ncbi:hypothetical protein LTR36_001998 [Oleoguttula mirabilis]|uniref:Heterokaryon incompatibility domain-containing protein n=1 Tax=Oleoguttula mirabilis TaxID=1507867 RepID=A0AAV9JLD5_9PEZI|nr:hypothetical protein LTR36_001998 [Oleoguttula mirabilis]
MAVKPLGPWNDSTRTQLGKFQLPVLADPHSHIRLIRMQAGGKDKPIVCELTSTSLKDAPPYAAISNTWGDPTPVTDISLNGQLLKVHHNYAICIDQANSDEKSAQVQLMGDIFSGAGRVVVSLGSHGDESQFLLHIARELDASAWCMKLEMASTKRKALRAEWMDHMGLSEPDSLQRLAYAWHHFCDRPYWHRVWIVQEFILAQPLAVTFICDTDSIDLYLILQLYDDIMIDMMSSDEINATPFTKILKITDRVDMGFPPLADALRFCNDGGCSDVRDRIYGFLRLCYWPDDIPALSPDYTRSTFQVALESVKYLE